MRELSQKYKVRYTLIRNMRYFGFTLALKHILQYFPVQGRQINGLWVTPLWVLALYIMFVFKYFVCCVQYRPVAWVENGRVLFCKNWTSVKSCVGISPTTLQFTHCILWVTLYYVNSSCTLCVCKMTHGILCTRHGSASINATPEL